MEQTADLHAETPVRPKLKLKLKCPESVVRIAKKVSAPFEKIRNVQTRAAVITLLVMSVIWIVAWIAMGLFPLGDQSLCTNDGYAQYMPFLSEFWSIFREGGSVFYSWHGGLGGNFYLTIAYYLMSPFTFLALLFDRTMIPFSANLIIVLKNILVGVLMAWYLPSRLKRPRKAMPAVACAVTYAFSFYFMAYAVNFMWMDSIALVPLMLYGMERIDTRKGRAIYLISLAMAIYMNFYMGAVICIFLAFYELVILVRLNSRKGWIDFAWFALCSICAALIAGMVLLPVIQGMLMDNVSRMSPPDFEIFSNAEYFFSRMLPDADIVRITRDRGDINIYMGSSCLFLCLLYVFCSRKPWRERLGLSGLCLLYLAATQISWLNYAFHGFYMQRLVPNRFGFIIALLAALMMFGGLQRLRKTKFSSMAVCAGVSALFFALCMLCTDLENWWIAIVLTLALAVYLFTAAFGNRTLLCWMILAEACGCLSQAAPGSLSDSYMNMQPNLQAAGYTTEGRSDILTCDIVNAPALYGFKGVSAFNSVINPDTADILGKLGFASGENYYRVFGHTPISDLLLGFNMFAADSDEMVPAPYVAVANIGDLIIWKSPWEMPIASDVFNNVDLYSRNKFTNLNELFPGSFNLLTPGTTIETSAETEETDEGYSLKEIKKGETTIVTIDPIEAKDMYVYGFLSGTQDYEVVKNGTTIHKDRYEGDIVYVGDVTESDTIELCFTAKADREKADLRLQFASLTEGAVDRAVYFLQEGGLKNQKISATGVVGSYDTDEEKDLVFTIPYDPGWSARVNGEDVELTSYKDGFLKIHLQAGHSEISLSYRPMGFDTGVLITTEGIVLAAIILIFPLKKKKGAKAAPASADQGDEAEPFSTEVTLYPLDDEDEDPDPSDPFDETGTLFYRLKNRFFKKEEESDGEEDSEEVSEDDPEAASETTAVIEEDEQTEPVEPESEEVSEPACADTEDCEAAELIETCTDEEESEDSTSTQIQETSEETLIVEEEEAEDGEELEIQETEICEIEEQPETAAESESSDESSCEECLEQEAWANRMSIPDSQPEQPEDPEEEAEAEAETEPEDADVSAEAESVLEEADQPEFESSEEAEENSVQEDDSMPESDQPDEDSEKSPETEPEEKSSLTVVESEDAVLEESVVPQEPVQPEPEVQEPSQTEEPSVSQEQEAAPVHRKLSRRERYSMLNIDLRSSKSDEDNQ